MPDPSVPDLLDRIDTSLGCSIKDSFASLDLTAFGFRVLFEAQWIVAATAGLRRSVTSPRWAKVGDADAFAAWETAWRGHDGPPGVLLVDLLGHDSVSVLAASDGDRVVAGAVLNRSTEVVGITNFFADPGIARASWDGCVSLAAELFPRSILAGYESGSALEDARTSGFEAVGPLRVWIRERETGPPSTSPPSSSPS